MNIAFDATAILGPGSKNRGIGNYSCSQFKTLLEIDKKNQYYCLNLFEDSIFGNDTSQYSNLKEFKFWCGRDRFFSMNRHYIDVYKNLVQRFIKNNKIDVFYITSPFDGHVFPYQRDWFGDINVIATVYDIIPYVMKDMYLQNESTHEWYMRCIDCSKQFDKYLAISNCTKSDLIKHLGIDEKKIDVIHGAPNDIYRKIDVSDEAKKHLYNKFSIKNNYVLLPGGDDYRKNLKETIKAYSQIPKYLVDEYQLIIVCGLSPNAVEYYTSIIASYNLEDRVILTNYVTDEELLQLYNLTSLVAFPSQYEGFGLPIVEAFSCGVPVLTSNNSSLSEIAENSAVLVDPFSISDIARGLEFALTEADNELHIKNGYEKLKTYSWNNVAYITFNAINTLEINKSTEDDRKRIAFFTPLPPLESGISDYSVDILNMLSKYFDIDVFIDDKYDHKCTLSENITVLNHRLFTNKSNEYFNIIYQIGNSVFHIYMFQYVKKYAGTIVLHDYNLHLVAHCHSIALSKDYKLYEQYLTEDYPGWQVAEYLNDLKTLAKEPDIYNMPLNGLITNYTKSIIVHSEYSKEKLLYKDICRNVQVIRHYAKIEERIDPAQVKEKYRYNENDIIIASFGHIHENKRSMPALKAFCRLAQKYENVLFLFAGKMDLALEKGFKSYVQKNNLTNKVKVTGYIDLDTFIDYIDLADICVNLRYPYNGETSGSLMRVLAKGKCIIVNDIGSFSEIPNDCCIKLPSAGTLTEDEELDCIHQALEKLVDNPELRETLSECARMYAEDNLNLENIAEQYYDVIMDKHLPTLSEEIIQDIVNQEILDKNYSRDEIKQISETLAYSMNTVHKKFSLKIPYSKRVGDSFQQMRTQIKELKECVAGLERLDNLNVKDCILKEIVTDENNFWLAFHAKTTDPIALEYLEGLLPNAYMVDIMQDLTNPGDQVVDLGVHLGTFSIPSALLGRNVLGVDANHAHVEICELSKRVNKAESLTLIYAAVGEELLETVPFVEDGLWGHIDYSGSGDEVTMVPAKSLKSILSENGFDNVKLIKLDIEGAELPALQSILSILESDSSPALLYESNEETFLRAGYSVFEIRKWLEAIGYKTYRLENSRYVYAPPEQAQPELWTDMVALRSSHLQKIKERVDTHWPLEQMIGRIIGWGTLPHQNARKHIASLLQTDRELMEFPELPKLLDQMLNHTTE